MVSLRFIKRIGDIHPAITGLIPLATAVAFGLYTNANPIQYKEQTPESQKLVCGDYTLINDDNKGSVDQITVRGAEAYISPEMIPWLKAHRNYFTDMMGTAQDISGELETVANQSYGMRDCSEIVPFMDRLQTERYQHK